eukprot:2503592-Pleurochrysis_carterae.AAC.4
MHASTTTTDFFNSFACACPKLSPFKNSPALAASLPKDSGLLLPPVPCSRFWPVLQLPRRALDSRQRHEHEMAAAVGSGRVFLRAMIAATGAPC